VKLKLRIAIVAVAAGAFLVLQLVHHKEKATQPPAQAAQPIHVVAKPRVWQRGSLTFKPCNLSRPGTGRRVAAWCAPFAVPENRADPQGRTIHLKLAMVRSDAAVPDPDIVVLLAGGPGQAATRAYVDMARYFEGLRKHHDILLLDQRGTGGSHALTCPKVQKQSKEQKIKASPNLDLLRENLKKCLAEIETKADPRFYTTTDAEADLEAVRQALGKPAFDLIGVSYGTRMAQEYAMHYPASVRSIVLDSAVPNTAVLGQHVAVHLQQALRKDFALCTADAACSKRFGDPMQTLMKLKAKLATDPHEVSIRDPRTYKLVQHKFDDDSLASVVRLFAYTSPTIALLPLSIHAAANGDPGPLLGQQSIISGQLDHDIDLGMSLSVTCSEDADLIKDRPQDKDTLLGDRFIRELKAQCAIWPHGKRPADFHQPFTGDIPTLVLSGELDPITPPYWGKQIVAHLSDARQLVLKGQGHGEIQVGCTPRIVRRFIDKLDPKTLDASCLKRLGPTPMYLNYNGAKP